MSVLGANTYPINNSNCDISGMKRETRVTFICGKQETIKRKIKLQDRSEVKIKSIIFSVDCSIAWQDNVETTGCVTRSLILNGWISLNVSMAMSPDDQRALLMGSLNQFLNGSFHTIVELSARFVL